MNQRRKVSLEEALATPGQVFDAPQDVVDNQNFSDEEKIKILTNWKDQHIQLQRATSEGMEPHHQNNILRQISNALENIES
jgi:hypothetical protein